MPNRPPARRFGVDNLKIGILTVFLLTSISGGLFLSPDAASAAAGSSVSCSQKGRIVFKRSFEKVLTENQQAAIENTFPKALCIFVDEAPSFDFSSMPSSGDGLATALAIISQGGIGEAYPDSIEGMIKPSASANAKDVAVSVYKHMAVKDILAHWKQVSTSSPELARLTTSIKTMGQVSLLSLKDVPESQMLQVCSLLADRGLKCLTTFK